MYTKDPKTQKMLVEEEGRRRERENTRTEMVRRRRGKRRASLMVDRVLPREFHDAECNSRLVKLARAGEITLNHRSPREHD